MSWNNGGNTRRPGRPWRQPGRNGPAGRRRRAPSAAHGAARGPGGGRARAGGPGMPDLDEVIAAAAGRPAACCRAAAAPAARRCRLLGLLAGRASHLAGQRLLPRPAGRAGRGAALRRLQGLHLPGPATITCPGPIEQALTPAVTRVNRIEVGYPHRRDRLDRNRAETGREVPAESADADRRREHHRHQLLRVLAHQGRRAPTCSTPATPTRPSRPPRRA